MVSNANDHGEKRTIINAKFFEDGEYLVVIGSDSFTSHEFGVHGFIRLVDYAHKYVTKNGVAA